ncbi:hypothetical protein FAGAP_1264 [Fusarium agapanthi]|uniref:C2H2-type domain-containing protein n=1 Tax=Fusarium agapanthi TaxID=1803897 RepID=A0A9P5BI41_9HYPO|nr:hypothetical protein FAGAP_1264 [Fusarium agapanthi]
MSDSVDSTNPGGAAAGDVTPTKLSLRDLEAARNGVATLEENSLLGMGDGRDGPPIDLTGATIESHVPSAGVLPLLPFRMLQPELTEVMSSSEPSHSGPSYTVPTQSVSHASNLHHDELLLASTDEPERIHSLSWIPEFSWQDARLCFDGQPLELPATRDDQFSRGGPGSEYEESSGNGQNPTATDTSPENSLLWACPFMKWNPRKYRGSCVKKLRDIYRLKKHLQEKHFSHHCYICFKEFRPEELTRHEQVCESQFGRPTRPPPVGLITRDMATAIKERSNTRLTSRQQWERLFKIIFPHEPIPSSPYLDDERKLAHCYEYFRRRDVRVQAREMIHESGLGHLRKTMLKSLFEQLVAELWDELDVEHEISPYVASEEETVDQAQPISTTEDYIPEDSQTPASRGFGYDQNGLNAVQPTVVIGADNTTTPLPEPFGDQSETGVGEDLDRLQFIDTYGFSCSDVTGNVNFEEIGSDPFSRPGAEDILWYGGQETFEADLGQMRDD